jgi:hypothetical protein
VELSRTTIILTLTLFTWPSSRVNRQLLPRHPLTILPLIILCSQFKFGLHGSVKRYPDTSTATEARCPSSPAVAALDFQEQMLRNALNLSVPWETGKKAAESAIT